MYVTIYIWYVYIYIYIYVYLHIYIFIFVCNITNYIYIYNMNMNMNVFEASGVAWNENKWAQYENDWRGMKTSPCQVAQWRWEASSSCLTPTQAWHHGIVLLKNFRWSRLRQWCTAWSRILGISRVQDIPRHSKTCVTRCNSMWLARLDQSWSVLIPWHQNPEDKGLPRLQRHAGTILAGHQAA